MSLEAWSTAASIGTFVVIAATAVAALVQLRHLRASNEIAAITEMRETLESEKFAHAMRFVAEQMPKLAADAGGRGQLGAEMLPEALEPLKVVANFFETMGVFVKLGIIDRTAVCDPWDGVVFKTWKQLEPAVVMRRKVSHSGTWASFEFLAVICEQSLAKRQGDYYPRGMARMSIDQRSMEVAAAFDPDKAGTSPNGIS